MKILVFTVCAALAAGCTTEPDIPSVQASSAADPGGNIVPIETDVTSRVDEAVETAKASPPPGEDVLTTQLWADGGSAWRN